MLIRSSGVVAFLVSFRDGELGTRDKMQANE